MGVSEQPTVEERCAALERRHPSWPSRTLADALDAAAAEFPDRPFVLTDELTVTYREMADWSGRLARGLLARGVRPGENVALVLSNRPELVALLFAVARAGAVAVPISFQLRARELSYVLRQSRSVGLVTVEGFRDLDHLAELDAVAPGWESRAGGDEPRAGGDGRRAGGDALPSLRFVATCPDGEPRRSGVPTVSELEAGSDALDPPGASADDPATIFYTSGTTGHPKGVVLTHDMELRSAYGSALTRAFEDGVRILFALPLHHVFAYIEGLLASMFVGGGVVIQQAFDPVTTLRGIERHRASEALFVPTMTLAVIDAARAGEYDLGSLHSVMSAAASAPERLWREVVELLGVRQLVTAYGMTETAAATTFTMPDDPIEDLVDTVGRPKLGGVAGDPSLGGRLAEYKAVDPMTGEDLAPGTEGELAARGPIITHGYYDAPDETAAAFTADGWLRSGDLGRIRDDGYLLLTGRSKDLYKCGAELVMPQEIEALLTERGDVSQAYVVPLPDERMGEVGCAFVVPAEGAEPSPEELIEHCRGRLARFKVPAHVLFIAADELPLTASGKVQRFRLSERAEQAVRRPVARPAS